MCPKYKNIYAWREQAIREIATHDLYCCLLPQCETLRTCRSGFPIATVENTLAKISTQFCNIVIEVPLLLQCYLIFFKQDIRKNAERESTNI